MYLVYKGSLRGHDLEFKICNSLSLNNFNLFKSKVFSIPKLSSSLCLNFMPPLPVHPPVSPWPLHLVFQH